MVRMGEVLTNRIVGDIVREFYNTPAHERMSLVVQGLVEEDVGDEEEEVVEMDVDMDGDGDGDRDEDENGNEDGGDWAMEEV